MECSSPRFLQSQNFSIGVIIRDSFDKTVAVMNKILPLAYTAEAMKAFALQQGGHVCYWNGNLPCYLWIRLPLPHQILEHKQRQGWNRAYPPRHQNSKAFLQLVFVPALRDGNKAAHELAREARLWASPKCGRGSPLPKSSMSYLMTCYNRLSPFSCFPSVIIQFLSWNEYHSCFTNKKKKKKK